MAQISFETTQEAVDALDTIAASLHMDREQVLRDAVMSYIAWDRDFRASVEEGMLQLEREEVVPHEEVVAMFHEWQAAQNKK